MNKIKGVVQLKRNYVHLTNDEKSRILTYLDDGSDMLNAVTRTGTVTDTAWESDRIVGRDHAAFSNFHLWFEYDT